MNTYKSQNKFYALDPGALRMFCSEICTFGEASSVHCLISFVCPCRRRMFMVGEIFNLPLVSECVDWARSGFRSRTFSAEMAETQVWVLFAHWPCQELRVRYLHEIAAEIFILLPLDGRAKVLDAQTFRRRPRQHDRHQTSGSALSQTSQFPYGPCFKPWK